MPAPDVSAFTHSHQFNHVDAKAERNTRRVVYITAAMMVVEIAGGYWLNSMALLADGWHMSSHALAMGLSVMAYALARRYAKDGRFAFGTWKIEILGGYSSALLLAVVAALMMVQSLERLFVPATIHYDDAILIAVLGLGVNLLCAWLLKGEHPHAHGHAHGHDHGHGHDNHHHDVNLRAAYLHVIADAATSVLAIVALVGGKLYGAAWLDPVMGIVGSILVARWRSACCASPAGSCWTPRWTSRWSMKSATWCAISSPRRRSATCTSGASAATATPASSAWWPPRRSAPRKSAGSWPCTRNWCT